MSRFYFELLCSARPLRRSDLYNKLFRRPQALHYKGAQLYPDICCVSLNEAHKLLCDCWLAKILQWREVVMKPFGFIYNVQQSKAQGVQIKHPFHGLAASMHLPHCL